METVPRLFMKSIGKRFGGVLALEDVSLSAHAGEVLAVCGENGAGKSTLMKILAGAITDYEGELFLDGNLARFSGPRAAEKHGVAIIHQELNLVPQLSAAANIFLGREATRGRFWLDDRAMERAASTLFEQLGAHFSPRARVSELRIGDQQLVEIAKALSLDASILILDEPTSALAEAEVARLFAVIERLKARGVTMLYISHKMDEVFRLADRVAVLRDGRLVDVVPRDRAQPADIIKRMVGRPIASLRLDTTRSVGDEVLRVSDLSLGRAGTPNARRLERVDLTLRRGEILGVAGLLGAGRTELLECLFGALGAAPSGTMEIAGTRGIPRSPREAIARGIALVTEDRKTLGLFDQLSVAGNITICHLNKLTSGMILRGSRERRAARESVKRWGIRAASIGAPILSLSGGNQQKCILARWLLTNPTVLLLDEPTRGIDVGAKAEIYVLLRELCHQGVAIIMTSSELPELLTVCDRIMVLCEGRKTADLDRTEATEEAIMHAAMRFASTEESPAA